MRMPASTRLREPVPSTRSRLPWRRPADRRSSGASGGLGRASRPPVSRTWRSRSWSREPTAWARSSPSRSCSTVMRRWARTSWPCALTMWSPSAQSLCFSSTTLPSASCVPSTWPRSWAALPRAAARVAARSWAARWPSTPASWPRATTTSPASSWAWWTDPR